MPRLALVFALLLAAPVQAAPRDYVLEPTASTVGFETDFGTSRITGRMPVSRADLTLDFDRVVNSTVAVTLDVRGAKASFPFAAEAMKGPDVLDARSFPEITFLSTAVRAKGDAAEVEGRLTIRGVTRPITLGARIFRQQGSAPGDLGHLTVRLTGTVQRSDFGAAGFIDLVGDDVRLDILARIRRID